MADPASQPEPKKKGKLGLILILVVAVLALGGGAAGGVFLLKGRAAAKAAGAKGESTAENGAGGKAAEGGKGGEAAEAGVLSLDSFIANLADPGGERYLKCTLRLQVDKREVAERLKGDELGLTRLRDKILTVLTSKTFSDVSTAEGKDNLRQQLRNDLDPLLMGGHVAAVYFTEFIVQ
jgi:flagellar FliL protein